MLLASAGLREGGRLAGYGWGGGLRMGVGWDNSGWKGPWGAQPTTRAHWGCLWGQTGLLRAWLRWILKTSEAGEGPASLGAP